VRGLKSSSRVLTNASELRVRQGSGQLNTGLLLTGKVYLALGIPLQSGWWTGSRASGLVHTINSASELRAIDKHLAGVEDKSKVIIARFDIGEALPFSESGAV